MPITLYFMKEQMHEILLLKVSIHREDVCSKLREEILEMIPISNITIIADRFDPLKKVLTEYILLFSTFIL